MAALSIEDGSVKMPETSSGVYVGPVTVASGATFYLNDLDASTLFGLKGDGLVTNTVASGYKNLALESSSLKGAFDFSGRIAGRIYYGSRGYAMLRGTNNVFDSGNPFSVINTSTAETDFEKYAARGVGMTGIACFGYGDGASTIGTDGVRTVNNGGGFLYLGTGETTDKSFTLAYPNQGLSFLDAGATGGLIWNGAINGHSTRGMGIFGFMGSNTETCVFGGQLNVTGPNCLFIVKDGTGTWRFADTDENRTKRTFWTSMAVAGGTLQFDSMEEAGSACSLGLATNLTAQYKGTRDDDGHPGDYAYILGKTGRTVTFELVGTNGAFASKRPIALVGDARLKNDTAHPWRFSGVSPSTTGAKTLYLSGSSMADNEIAGIADSPNAPVSVVKDGDGTWILNGSNTFSGTVKVNVGTLGIRGDPGAYSWYRWTVRGKPNNTAKQMYLTEFALYDAEGNRVNTGLSYVTNSWHDLAAGQISIGRFDRYGMGAATQNRSLTALVDGSTSPCNFGYYVAGGTTYESPVTSNPLTWIPFVMRLAEDSAPAAYYDVCIHYPSSAEPENLAANPNDWQLEGSPDGVHWDVLHEVTSLAMASAAYTWAKSGVVYTSTTATESGVNGYAIATNSAYAPSGAFTNTLSVASGATLEAVGAVTLSSVAVDASDFGTIDGFSLADDGVLYVTNLPADDTIGKVFANASDIANLAGWALSIDGETKANWSIAVGEDGTVRVIRPGTVLFVR